MVEQRAGIGKEQHYHWFGVDEVAEVALRQVGMVEGCHLREKPGEGAEMALSRKEQAPLDLVWELHPQSRR